MDAGLSPADVRALRRRLRLSWLALVWERIWRAAWAAVSLAGVALALALSDLIAALPGWLHLMSLIGLGGGLGALLWRGFRGFALPTRGEAAARLQADAPHRPLTVLADQPAMGAEDALGARLWRAQRRAAASAARALRPDWPHPGVPGLDPWGLRAVPVLALVVAGVAAWGEVPDRLTRFVQPDLRLAGGPPPVVEAWLTPPPYTGRGQLYRTSANGEAGPVQVPEGTRLLVLIHDAGRPRLLLGEEALPLAPVEGDDATTASPTWRLDMPLAASLLPGEALTARDGGRVLASWPLAVSVDAPPIVTPDGPFEAAARDRLRLPFTAVDDYGIAGAWVEITRGEAPAERVALPLPATGARVSAAPSLDLTAHRWAGLRVEAKVVVRDGKGQEGVSDPQAIILPERLFTHPVAQALAGLRRKLLDDPQTWARVAQGLDDLSAAPGGFDGDLTVFLGLRVAASGLRTFEAVQAEGVGALMWALAERLEDGGLGEAERSLTAAQQALAEALRQGADPETMRQRVEALRQALRQYMQALAQRMPELADSLGLDPDQAEALSAATLDSLLDQMMQMNDLGARDAAADALRQLEGMLDALRNARPMPAQTLEALKGLGKAIQDLTRDQEALLNQTFEQGRQHLPPPPPDRSSDALLPEDVPLTLHAPTLRERLEAQKQRSRAGTQPSLPQGSPEDRAKGARMAEQQDALRRRLGELMTDLAGQSGGTIPPSLGEAELHMRAATDALAGQAWSPAMAAQGEALKALRQGGQQAAQQLMQALGRGLMVLPGGMGGGTDPMGRATGGGDDGNTKLPTRPEATRAKELIDELRRRYGEHTRPEDERDYYRRLLKSF